MDQMQQTESGLQAAIEYLIPSWRNREDSEHEQAVIRLLVGLTVAAYLCLMMITDGREFTFSNSTIRTILGFLAATLIILGWLLISPSSSPVRRLTGAVVDIGSTSLAIYLNGSLAAPLLTVFLWVTFGNGFRFGRGYLYFSMILSLTGYSLVLLFSREWLTPVPVSIGLFLCLIVLPLYVSALLGRLTRALYAAQEASRAKSTFLAVMSHEIRTPLSGIVGLIALIQQTPLNSKQRHYMKLIENSSGWLFRVISDSLDYTKIEANELVIERVPFSLTTLLDDVSKVFTEVTASRGLRFSSQRDEALPSCLLGDQIKLIQVLNNLLSNGCKFTESGEIKLRTEMIGDRDGGAEILFEVEDSGIGIAKEDLPFIFKPFQQVDSSTARNHQGSGLGLTISSRIVAMMGGDIQVESEPGKGTTFRFTLTLPLCHPTECQPERSSSSDGPLPWHHSPHILLVEDNDINREVLEHLIVSLGCKVKTTTNGVEALDALNQSNFDLVYMDCQMPVLNGYETTQQIRQLNTKMKDVIIVALTAHITKADRNRCLAVGMNDYLGKPCNLAELRSNLQRWLSHCLVDKPDQDQKEPAADPVEQPDPLPSLPENSRPNRHHLHDLRNCYTKILGSAELAAIHKASPEKQEKYLRIIMEQVEKATEISCQIQ